MLFRSAAEQYRTAAIGAELNNELSVALARLETEVRDIPHKSGTATPDITSATATALQWSNSGACSLTLTGSQLTLAVQGGADAALLSDVTGLAVQCYDQANAPLASTLSGAACDAIRRISVSVTLTRSGVSTTLRTKVFLRCTMQGAG